MGAGNYKPTGKERFFDQNEFIVSKTDLKGRITYANQVFLRTSGYSESELLGAPHNIIRHPDMPRSVFKFLWDTIMAGEEVFAYVVNLCKGGDHYWVLAHVTPTFNARGDIVAYHSARRVPTREAISKVKPLYSSILVEEARHTNRKVQCEIGLSAIRSFLEEENLSYNEFVFSLASGF